MFANFAKAHLFDRLVRENDKGTGCIVAYANWSNVFQRPLFVVVFMKEAQVRVITRKEVS